MTADEYVAYTAALLCNYRSLQRRVAALAKQAESLVVKIDSTIAPSIAHYGNSVMGGGNDNTSPVEKAAGRRAAMLDEHSQLQAELTSLNSLLSAIDAALADLPPNDITVLLMHYCDGLNWIEVSKKLGMSRKWCSILGNNALIKLSLLLYGSAVTAKSLLSKASTLEREASP